jgi:hypothetical protein
VLEGDMKALKMYIIGLIMSSMDMQDLIGMVTAVVHRKDGYDRLKERMNDVYEEQFG